MYRPEFTGLRKLRGLGQQPGQRDDAHRHDQDGHQHLDQRCPPLSTQASFHGHVAPTPLAVSMRPCLLTRTARRELLYALPAASLG